MANFTTINKSTDYFNPVKYTGDGNATQAITNTFQTDFSWIKDRGVTAAHTLQDAVRGFDVTKKLSSNSDDAENNASGATWENYGGVTAVGATSFTTSLGSNTPYQTNASGSNYISWNWKMGTTTGLSGGTITPSSYSINTTAGQSIIAWTGTGVAGTVPHGLGAIPELIIVKNLSSTQDWPVYLKTLGNGNKMELNTNNTTSASSNWNSTSPTSSLFSIGTAGQVNTNAENYVAYCFTPIDGYSRMGSYVGNGSTDGPFVYTGFKPTFVLLKSSTVASKEWFMQDNKRLGYNTNSTWVTASLNNAEATNSSQVGMDMCTNGFKITVSDSNYNTNAETYQWMAFGQTRVGTNNVMANGF
tara:strand:+ start:1463 stop:2539 length:1077 start_codon:yes stop_codon:yes gene_type:complete